MDCSTGIRKVKKNRSITHKPNKKTDRSQSFDNFNCPEICDRSLQFAKEINDRSYYSLYNLWEDYDRSINLTKELAIDR
jgi:hypothetical protein